MTMNEKKMQIYSDNDRENSFRILSFIPRKHRKCEISPWILSAKFTNTSGRSFPIVQSFKTKISTF